MPILSLTDEDSTLTITFIRDNDDEGEIEVSLQSLNSKLTAILAKAETEEALQSQIDSILSEADGDVAIIDSKLSALLAEKKKDAPSCLIQSEISLVQDSDEVDFSDDSQDSDEEELSDYSSSEEEEDSKPAARKVIIDPNSRYKANQSEEARKRADRQNAANRKHYQKIKSRNKKKHRAILAKRKNLNDKRHNEEKGLRKKGNNSNKPHSRVTFRNFPDAKKQMFKDINDYKNNCHEIEADNYREWVVKLVRKYRRFKNPKGVEDITENTILSYFGNWNLPLRAKERKEYGLI